MSNEQWALLMEYDNWRAQKENETVDLSTAAFQKEWEAKFDRKRIEEAVAAIAESPRGDDDTERLLERIHDILVGDRPVIEDSAFGGPSTVTFV